MTLALVTGAPGWLGTALVHALRDGLPEVPALREPLPGRSLRCLHLPGADLGPLGEGVEGVTGDLRDEASVAAFLRGAEGATLFHAAGVIHPARGTREFHQVNVEGTRRLVEAAVGAGVRRLVFVSSNSPFGVNAAPDQRFDEGAPYRPYLGYGRSKMLAEQCVLAAGRSTPLEVVVVRPPWFYGPRQPARQNLFFTMIRKGRVPIVGGGENRRSMAYLDNLCQGLLLAERVPEARGEAFWIADERPYSMNEIVDTVERLLETEFGLPCAHRRLRLPAFASSVAYGVDATLQAMGLYHQKVHVLSEMSRTIACSVDKARRVLGYRPTVALEEGMRRSIRWALEHGASL